MVTCPKILLECTVKAPTINVDNDTIITEYFLLIFHFSVIKAIGTSAIDKEAVVAAMDARIKKAIISRLPNGICENTKGIVLNNRLGPEFGLIPKVNTTGNIAIPANRETNVSDNATLADVWIKLLSSVK